jgi:hypothetical protein
MERLALRLAYLSAMSATALHSSAVHADISSSPPQTRPIQVAVELGYAFPMGDLERGSEVGDVVHGLVPLGVEVGYRFNTTVAVVVHGAYAFGIPTLCATASDCIASLGHDMRLGLGGRFTLPRLGPVRPELRATFGYEWFRSDLSDNDVSSGRSYRGPVLASLQASGNFGSDAKQVGVFVGPCTGIFAHRDLETPAFSSSAMVDAVRVHVWLDVGIRGMLRF